MHTVITFSDSSELKLTLHDTLSPICYENGLSCLGAKESVEWNVHNGLIPYLLTFFKKHDYFFINDEQNVVYNSKSVIKIETFL